MSALFLYSDWKHDKTEKVNDLTLRTHHLKHITISYLSRTNHQKSSSLKINKSFEVMKRKNDYNRFC
jgi:hypothetical protein